ncbi:Oidioi.mRNA.OKI2018_I69.chr1.g3823.t1.cds [Oikopleura dioica]|uniref:Oidioi.mRNA.OKI2018_I69.chr1.g3823.t1.cds n=1 Tax=Oikopleura dioica TaxID=34765 RepID=A0ABN7SVW2_OIKDI|nr:Oidioi.mRNA.OKI2018_I69.chr1.g3823.t1.cds [Oikopleura dioica]
MMKSFEPDPSSLHHVTEESIAEERKIVEEERQKRIKFLEEKQEALEKILAVVENYPSVDEILTGSEGLKHVEVEDNLNQISAKTSSGAYKNIEREIERIIDQLEVLDSFSDEEEFDESDGYFDLSQIETIIRKSEDILSTKISHPLDSIDGKTMVYDKFDAIRDEIDNGAESYDSDLLYESRIEAIENLATDYPEMTFSTIANKSTQTPIPKSKAKEMVATSLIDKIPAEKAMDSAKQLAEKLDIRGKLTSLFSGLTEKLSAFAAKIGADKILASAELEALLVDKEDFSANFHLNPDVFVQTIDQFELDWTLFREFGTQVTDDLKLNDVL